MQMPLTPSWGRAKQALAQVGVDAQEKKKFHSSTTMGKTSYDGKSGFFLKIDIKSAVVKPGQDVRVTKDCCSCDFAPKLLHSNAVANEQPRPRRGARGHALNCVHGPERSEPDLDCAPREIPDSHRLSPLNCPTQALTLHHQHVYARAVELFPFVGQRQVPKAFSVFVRARSLGRVWLCSDRDIVTERLQTWCRFFLTRSVQNCTSRHCPRNTTKSVMDTEISSRVGSPLWLASTNVWSIGNSAVPRTTT